MNDFMVDLETLDVRVTAAILSIGVVQFDVSSRAIGDSFYCNVDLESCISKGLTVSSDTFQWWMEQSEAARSRVVAKGIPLPNALYNLSAWIKERTNVDEAVIWGNGAAFDNAILRNAYSAHGMLIPWKHWNDRCYRTVKNMHPNVKLVRVGTFHDPRDDAESQARHLIAMLNP